MSLTILPEADRLRHQLVRDEGLRLKPYKDTVGKLTIGVGRNLDDRGITQTEAMYLLDNDIHEAMTELTVRYAHWFPTLDPARQGALINMCINLGIKRLMGFKDTLAYFRDGNYERAAVEMLDSTWAEQVGDRALRLAEQVRTGRWI